MQTIAEIRATYPTPVSGPLALQCDYCVGGALALTLDETAPHFPTGEHLAHVLRQYNPMLPGDTALRYANLIIMANDRADFERAWYLAGKAIRQTQIPQPL